MARKRMIVITNYKCTNFSGQLSYFSIFSKFKFTKKSSNASLNSRAQPSPSVDPTQPSKQSEDEGIVAHEGNDNDNDDNDNEQS